MGVLKWMGDKVLEIIKNDFDKRITLSVAKLSRHARKKMSRIGSSGANHSKPGEYPFKQTGHLRNGIVYEYDHASMTGRWGTNVLYGKFLELGTRPHTIVPIKKKVLADKYEGIIFGKKVTVSMKPRPWMSLTNQEMTGEVIQILSRPITGVAIETGWKPK